MASVTAQVESAKMRECPFSAPWLTCCDTLPSSKILLESFLVHRQSQRLHLVHVGPVG